MRRYGPRYRKARTLVAVEKLCVGRRLTRHASLVFEDVTEATVAEVLLCLHFLYLEDPPETCVERLTTVHRRSDPGTVAILRLEEKVLYLAYRITCRQIPPRHRPKNEICANFNHL